ncbi:MAG TPA: amidohydrolase family protein [Verrucomicrobiae bacterium]|nr:amidohydrolase family protein [Verrucomicrobiae bacterium]
MADPSEERLVPHLASDPSCGPSLGGVSRRTALKHVAAIGAGAALSTGSVLAAMPRIDSNPKRGRIDVHHHMLPPFYMDLRRAVPDVGAMPTWSPSKSIDDMEKNGVTTAMLSLAVSGVTFDAGEAGRSLARKSNDYGAQLVRDHPASFGLLAALPLPDPQGSLVEIEYALDTLHADGIALLSSYGDQWLGDATYAPVFEELNRRKAVVFVHPSAPNCCANLQARVPASTIEFYFDTTRTIESLLMSGTFSRFPNLRFIFSHGGGAMPILANRMARLFPKDLAAQAPNGVLYELKRQYYDTASASNPTSLTAIMSIVPSSQIVFGSDFPFLSAGEPAGELMHSGLPDNIVEAIDHNNAVRLFERLKG